MDLGEAITAQLEGRTVRVDYLVKFDFTDGTLRLWNGFFELKTTDGNKWRGAGALGSIDGLSQSINATAAELTLSLSGMEPSFAAKVKGDKALWYLQPVTVYLQFFDEDSQVLDAPVAIRVARMQTMKVRSVSGDSRRTATITIGAEGPFVTRRRPRFSSYTDRDQQNRFSGDKFCERVQGIEQKVVIFPDN
jgi:hypothetical protein